MGAHEPLDNDFIDRSESEGAGSKPPEEMLGDRHVALETTKLLQLSDRPLYGLGRTLGQRRSASAHSVWEPATLRRELAALGLDADTPAPPLAAVRAPNLGADDYLTKPLAIGDLVSAIRARLERKDQQTQAATAGQKFEPQFDSPEPLVAQLGLTAKEAEVLLWVAQGKANGDIATILNVGESTVKKHIDHIFEKLQVENRGAASLMAIELLSKPATPRSIAG